MAIFGDGGATNAEKYTSPDQKRLQQLQAKLDYFNSIPERSREQIEAKAKVEIELRHLQKRMLNTPV